jgi:hypothetical protein
MTTTGRRQGSPPEPGRARLTWRINNVRVQAVQTYQSLLANRSIVPTASQNRQGCCSGDNADRVAVLAADVELP